ncbi:MAG: cytochrome C [Deltaproteobacteria bacterium]|nr:MAG: cytochrome C [Deltaproteobacteria bacterium]
MRRYKLIFIVIGVLGILGFVSSISLSVNNQGPKRIVISGGGMGNIDFPHHQHQDALKNCKVCHQLFPKKVGSIAQLKKEGRLEKKQVMANCRGCHKERANEGMKAGPTSCNQCHNKELKLNIK